MASAKVCLAAIAGVHGVQGLVKLKTFTERPEDVVAYGPLSDESGGRQFRLTLRGTQKGLLLAAIEGVSDRTAAEALKGLRLYVAREALPPPEDPEEFYHADLIGLAVEDIDGKPLGVVRAVEDFGAGPLLDVESDTGSFLLPFTLAVVPLVDLSGRRLVADPPVALDAGPDGNDKPRKRASKEKGKPPSGTGQGGPKAS